MKRLLAGSAAVLALVGGYAPTAQAAMVDDDVAARDAEWWLSGLGVSAAQRVARGGEGVKVCLVDTGVDVSHPDLRGARFADGTDMDKHDSTDGLKPTTDPDVRPWDHGTTMAAWIVGQGHGPNHSRGILGVAPKATLMSVVTSEGNSQHAAGIRYCADRGAKVINMSNGYWPTRGDIAYALKRDAVVVSSVGNREGLGADPNIKDLSCTGVGGLQLGELTVGGVTKERKLSPESCSQADLGQAGRAVSDGVSTSMALGAPSNGGLKPDGSAFPLVLAEVVAGGHAPYDLNGGGTSTSAALTSGVVALVRAAHPELKAGDVINRLIRTASPSPSGASGPKGPVGFGVVNAEAAVSAKVPGTGGANPMGDPVTGDGGLWTNAAWTGSTASKSASASGSSSVKGASSGSGSSVVLWGAVGVVVVGALVIGGAVVASRRKRSA